MTIGEKIKFIRNFRGMTQKELGVGIGFHTGRNTYSNEAALSLRSRRNGTKRTAHKGLFAKCQRLPRGFFWLYIRLYINAKYLFRKIVNIPIYYFQIIHYNKGKGGCARIIFI